MNTTLGKLLSRVASYFAPRRRQSEFTCGDCERSDSCGQPPSDACVVAAAQMERGDWKLRRQARALARTVGPM
jgi:hypothetical protein